MRRLSLAGTLLALTTTLAGTVERPASLDHVADLLLGPGGQRVAVLLPGAQVNVVETRGEWSRVILEGWIRAPEVEAGAGTDTGPGAPGVSPQPEALPAAPAVARNGSIAGQIFVTDDRGRTTVGAGLALRLLGDPLAVSAEVEPIRAECDSSRAALNAEAADLKGQADRAMRSIDSPTAAFEAYDDLKRRRDGTLRRLQALDEACDARVEKAVDKHAVRRALSGPDGAFVMDGVPPGAYTLRAALDAGGARHEWDVRIALSDGQSLSLDLTNENRARSNPLPVYR